MSSAGLMIVFVVGVIASSLFHRLLRRKTTDVVAYTLGSVVFAFAMYPIMLWVAGEQSPSLHTFVIWAVFGTLGTLIGTFIYMRLQRR